MKKLKMLQTVKIGILGIGLVLFSSFLSSCSKIELQQTNFTKSTSTEIKEKSIVEKFNNKGYGYSSYEYSSLTPNIQTVFMFSRQYSPAYYRSNIHTHEPIESLIAEDPMGGYTSRCKHCYLEIYSTNGVYGTWVNSFSFSIKDFLNNKLR